MLRSEAIKILRKMKTRVVTDDMDTTIRVYDENHAIDFAILDMKLCAANNLAQAADIDDLNAIYTCALRYSFGRMTYMPGLVTHYIKRHADTVTDKELNIMIRDLREEIETAERVGDKHYGMDCDKRTWLDFYSWLLEEKARRDAKSCSGET